MQDRIVCSRVTGTGFYVPEKVITNEHFASYLETSDEWIRERTGIAERRWAEADVSTSQLAEPACEQAIARAGLKPTDIDGVVLATVTPDYVFPSTACFLQRRLGLGNGLAFDVNAVCSGFLYAIVAADALIARQLCRNVLVVGVDLYSRIIDPNDRGTCVLFGDGAGAVVLSATENSVAGGTAEPRGICGSILGSDGTHADILCVPSGTAAPVSPESLTADAHYLRMEGREVFKLAVRKLSEISEELLVQLGVAVDDVDHFVSHQANKRILMSMAKHLGVPEEKVLMNVERYGNTSAASVPILLSESEQQGKIQEGDLVLLSAFGGGVTWGASLLRW